MGSDKIYSFYRKNLLDEHVCNTYSNSDFYSQLCQTRFLASFDSETGEIIVEKNVGCLSDPNPNDNVYQKVLKGIESVTLDENETVEDREEYNIKEGDKIKLIHMTREEYDAEFRHQKQLNYLSFKVDNRDEGVEESFHIIHPDSEDIQKENETTEKRTNSFKNSSQTIKTLYPR